MSEAPDETPQGDEQETPAEPETPAVPTPDEDEDEAHEAEEVEGQQGDGDEPPIGDEPEQPQAQAQTLSQAEIEKRLASLDKEGVRHFKRVHEVMGDAMEDLTRCELCWSFAPGFRFDPIPDEQRAAVMLVLGMSGVGNYAEDRHSSACADCRGWGVVATGSKVQGQEALTCLNCKGRGWMGDRAEQVAAVPIEVPQTPQENGDMQFVPHPPEVEEAIRIAREHGAIVIEPTVPAPA